MESLKFWPTLNFPLSNSFKIKRRICSCKTLAINGFCITSTLKNHIELTITSLTDIYKRLSENYVGILSILKKKRYLCYFYINN